MTNRDAPGERGTPPLAAAPDDERPTPPTSPFRCSDAARERGDPLIGTAPPATRWLLIEQEVGWGRDALTSLDASATVRTHLGSALTDTGARLQLIRRPGIKPGRPDAPHWFVVDVGTPGRVVGGILDGWRDVIAALYAPEAASPTGGEPPPGAADEGVMLESGPQERPSPRHDGRDEPAQDDGLPAHFILVCTNGRHDVCCAVRGRPVAAALASRWPEAVWETTHTGGDRFATNAVILPDGVIYGGLDPGSAVEVMSAHHSGQTARRHVRGYIGLAPPEQATRLLSAPTLKERGLTSWDRSRVTAQVTRERGGWTCMIRIDGAEFASAHGHETVRPPQRLTCSAKADSPARVPWVDDLTITG